MVPETDEHEIEVVDQGPCKACLYEDELDSDGLCASCNPISQETRAALIALLSPVDMQAINEVIETSENQSNGTR